MPTMVQGTCEVNPWTKQPRIIISTDSVDSERDRHLVERSRVRIPLRVMLSHNYSELPLGQVDRRDQIVTQHGRMIAEFRWFENDERVARVKNIYDQGGFDASIGVADVAHEPNEHGGIDFWGEVIEFSLTPVPANRECVAVVRSVLARRDAPPPGSVPCDRYGRVLADDDLITIDLDALRAEEEHERVTVSDTDMRAVLRQVITEAAERAVGARFRHLTGRLD